jgi:4'-phosphopantetheinyl transferase
VTRQFNPKSRPATPKSLTSHPSTDRADTLRSGEGVAVWWLDTGSVTSSDLRRWLGLLDRSERDRARRFRIESDRRDFIAAHALLRVMLTYHFGVPPVAWRFLVDATGKPRIDPEAGADEIQFNLSHARGLVAVALASHCAVGVDVEEIKDASGHLAFAEAYFAQSEVELLRQAPPSERTRIFFRLWTLKEAYIKATGEGLNTSLNSFAFSLDPIRVGFLSGSGKDASNWRFACLPASDRHILSVAADWWNRGVMEITGRALTPQDL